MFICLAMVLTLVGIWAVADLDFAVGGDITYKAPEAPPISSDEVSYLSFEYYDDLTAKLVSCSSSAPQVVEIPEKVSKGGKTYTVTKIAAGYWDEADYEGEGVFYNASGRDVIIPDTITEIGNYAFNSCSFGTLSIGKAVECVASSPFKLATIQTLIIRERATKIGDDFFYCSSISSDINIPNGVIEIGEAAFMEIGKAKIVNIPDSVKKIGDAAFNCCYSLKSITIGSGVETIGAYAFFSNSSSFEVYIKAVNPPEIEVEDKIYFVAGDGFAIYVPKNSVDAYKNDSAWSDYADYIVGYDF